LLEAMITETEMKTKITISLYNLLTDNPNILTDAKISNRLSDKGFKDYFEQRNPDVNVSEFGKIKFYKLIEDIGIRWYTKQGGFRLTGNRRYFSDTAVDGRRTIVYVTELYKKTQLNLEDYKVMFEQMTGHSLAPDATMADISKAMAIEAQNKKKELMELIETEARKSRDNHHLKKAPVSEPELDIDEEALRDNTGD
jgi:hypothetical protein